MNLIKPTAAAAGVLAALGTLAAPNSAHACTPHTTGENYYATLHAVPRDAPNGAQILLETNSLNAATPTKGYVAHELFYGSGSYGYWVEVGVVDGLKQNTGNGHVVNRSVFWADRRDGYGYHEHYFNVSWASTGFYEASIESAGNNSWLVEFGHVNLGKSTSNPFYSTTRIVWAGIQASEDAALDTVTGYLLRPYRKSINNVWLSGWDTLDTGAATTQTTCPAAIREINSTEYHEVLHGPA